jgi:outer membrane protein assembly factor BamB
MKADSLGAGPVWSAQVGEPGALTGDHCQATAIWDGARLIVAGNRTTIGGTAYAGSVRSFDPSTGSLRWETGLTGPVFGSPTEDGAGVVAAATWGKAGTPNAAYLLDATNGNILATIGTGDSRVFAQPVFAGPFVLIATWDHGLIAYRP